MGGMHKFLAMVTKPFLVSAPRWVLVACISALIFLCGILTQQVRDLQGKNEILREEQAKVRQRALEDDTRTDVAVLKTIVADHARMMDRYWTALDKNSAAIVGLTRQVERLATATSARRNYEDGT